MWQEMIHLEVSLLEEHQNKTKHDVSLVSEEKGNSKHLLQLQLYCKNQGLKRDLFESACSFFIDYWPRFFPEFNLLEVFYHFSDINDFTLTLSYRQTGRVSKEIKDQVQEKVANLFPICIREAQEEYSAVTVQKPKPKLKKNKKKISQTKGSKTIPNEPVYTEKPSKEESLLLNEVREDKFTLLAKDFIHLKKQLTGTESNNEELHKEIQRQQKVITSLKQQLDEDTKV